MMCLLLLQAYEMIAKDSSLSLAWQVDGLHMDINVCICVDPASSLAISHLVN